MKIKRICQFCQKEFYQFPCAIKQGIGKYCSIECRSKSAEYREKLSEGKRGERNPNWKGGQYISLEGYVFIHKPDHPNCNSGGYIKRSRLVMEKYLGRFLTKKETVHHEDENKANDNINNLRLFENTGQHTKYHEKQKQEVNWAASQMIVKSLAK